MVLAWHASKPPDCTNRDKRWLSRFREIEKLNRISFSNNFVPEFAFPHIAFNLNFLKAFGEEVSPKNDRNLISFTDNMPKRQRYSTISPIPTSYPAQIMPSVTFNESSHSLHKSRFNTGTTTSFIAGSYAVGLEFAKVAGEEKCKKKNQNFVFSCQETESGLR